MEDGGRTLKVYYLYTGSLIIVIHKGLGVLLYLILVDTQKSLRVNNLEIQ